MTKPKPKEERSRYAVYRDKQRGGPPRRLKPHGTYAAFCRHLDHGEEPCEPCRQAERNYQNEQYEKRKARKQASS